MSAAVIVGLLVFSLRNNAVGAEPDPPQNVTLVTLNTHYTLSWDWNQSDAATFTTQYIGKFKLKSKKRKLMWSVACENATRWSCDLTPLDLHYLGSYVFRVRADVGGLHSDWVEKLFCPDEHAAVGPPSNVELSPAESLLDVIISDPLSSTNVSMKEVVRGLYYHMVYWEGSADSLASGVQTLTSHSNLVTLSHLKAWTWYCVRVQSRADFYNKSSSFTPPRCMQTEGFTPWWLIVLYFLGSLAMGFIVVLLVIYVFYRTYRITKATFFPSDQLPSHFRQYLCDSPGSDVSHLFTADSPSEALCYKVIVCPEAMLDIDDPPPVAPATPPSGLEPDSRYSRQDNSSSSSSSDSGVYSSGGVAGQWQPNTDQTSVEAESSWPSPLDSGRVKMEDLAPGPKGPPVITDEGVVDMSV